MTLFRLGGERLFVESFPVENEVLVAGNSKHLELSHLPKVLRNEGNDWISNTIGRRKAKSTSIKEEIPGWKEKVWKEFLLPTPFLQIWDFFLRQIPPD
jgi:hypothetical protein